MSLTSTPSQTVGPFFAIGLCRRPDHELDPDGAVLTGRLLDGQGAPMPDGMIELWDGVGQRWGRSGTDRDGRYEFRVPTDVGHLEVVIFARGLLRHQLTRIYLRDEDDAVLNDLDPAARATLLARHADGMLHFDIHMQGDQATIFFAH